MARHHSQATARVSLPLFFASWVALSEIRGGENSFSSSLLPTFACLAAVGLLFPPNLLGFLPHAKEEEEEERKNAN